MRDDSDLSAMSTLIPDPGRDADEDADPVHALPAELRNWQVLEVDGEATRVASADTPVAATPAALRISDHQDEFIVVSLSTRQVQVEAGATATLAVTVLNNSPQDASFRVDVEGWIDEHWLQDQAAQATLPPGERATLFVAITPPRQPTSEAQDHHLAIIVRSPHYPGHVARLGAILTVLPFTELALDVTRPVEPTVSWLRRTALLPVSVTNQGNCPVSIRLQGSDPQRICTFDFMAPGAKGGELAVTLRPGQAAKAILRVTVQQLPMVGLRGQLVPLQVTASAAISPAATSVARSALVARPLVGAWQMASATGLAFAGMLGFLLLTLVAILLTQVSQPPTVVQAPAVAPPPVIIVNLGQPAAAPATRSLSPTGQPVRSGEVSSLGAGSSPDPSLPLVLPDQVTAPQRGGPAPRPFEPPAVASSTAIGPPAASTLAAGSSADLTYAQMFQEIGQRYDLDLEDVGCPGICGKWF